MSWKWAIEGVVGRADGLSDRARGWARRVRPARGPFSVVPYGGYGTAERLWVRGRVLRDRGFAVPSPTDSAWRNLAELYKRMASDEVPGAELRARFAGVDRALVSDAEGYFEAELTLPLPVDAPGWHAVAVELVDPAPPAGEPGVRAAAPVLVPPSSARFGVISDIDDTVMWSNVTRRLRMLALLARSNAHTRKPFKGVAAFYRALRDGAGGDEGNPIFYVSSSPWNLHGPITDFMRLQGIPAGPLLLRDFGDHTLFSSGEHHRHKLGHIEAILERFPRLPFVLIGDSGEKDPEIYSQVVHRHPERIRAIYIRSVNADPSRMAAIDRLIEEVREAGVPLVLTLDSEAAARHAAAEGLVSAQAVDDVRADKRADERAPPP